MSPFFFSYALLRRHSIFVRKKKKKRKGKNYENVSEDKGKEKTSERKERRSKAGQVYSH